MCRTCSGGAGSSGVVRESRGWIIEVQRCITLFQDGGAAANVYGNADGKRFRFGWTHVWGRLLRQFIA